MGSFCWWHVLSWESNCTLFKSDVVTDRPDNSDLLEHGEDSEDVSYRIDGTTPPGRDMEEDSGGGGPPSEETPAGAGMAGENFFVDIFGAPPTDLETGMESGVRTSDASDQGSRGREPRERLEALQEKV